MPPAPIIARILPTHTATLFAAAVQQAAALLRAGETVALPTETVYGLAANALDAAAVTRVFAVKGRPAHNPIIVHVASLEMARQCTAAWPSLANRLARAFWPGPLTLVLTRSDAIPDNVAAGGPTVGVRWPAHPLMQAVIRECGFPLAAPSANLANHLSPTNAAHVLQQLGDRIPLILDGGQAQVGIESTVLDLVAVPPRILRPGMIAENALESVTGSLAAPESAVAGHAGPLRSPGQLARHYAPRARLLLGHWRDDASLRAWLAVQGAEPGGTCVVAHTVIPHPAGFLRVGLIPHDAEAFARALYAELHACDDAGARWIVVEAPPDSPEWRGIADRLARAVVD
jgi:L-threonylcarbamoyladenylate synthase